MVDLTQRDNSRKSTQKVAKEISDKPEFKKKRNQLSNSKLNLALFNSELKKVGKINNFQEDSNQISKNKKGSFIKMNNFSPNLDKTQKVIHLKLNFNQENIQSEWNNIQNNIVINNRIVTITNRDMKRMFLDDLLNNDKRSSWYFFKECFKEMNSISSSFYLKSLMRPYFIRISLFFLVINLEFTINALFYSDALIQEVNEYQGNVSY